MHSRIFQLSSQPINEDDYITEELFYEGFVGSIADYVSNVVDREVDIEWLVNCLEMYGVTRDGEAILFSEDFKEKFFKDRFEEFKNIAASMELKDFCDSFKTYMLRQLIEDKYGFYIYTDSHGLMTLDKFVRNVVEGEERFYIGGIIDYHF